MDNRQKEIDNLKDYKYGFTTDIENTKAPKGLNEDVIRFISNIKKEPQWMLDFRLNFARSAKAITAYLPLLDNFIFSAIYATYIYPTILVKINKFLKTCILSLNFCTKNLIFF